MIVLGVDHGEKRIGLAVSDPTGTLARPLAIIAHTTRADDAARVLKLADRYGATLVVIGESTDEYGEANLAGRRARRFAEELRAKGTVAIILWDESLSSQDARRIRIQTGVPRKKRQSGIDADAAAVILQTYLDTLELPSGDGGGA